jgi:hypothetical protein
LSKETLDDNSKFFAPGEESPRCAITMGIGTILEARKVLLLATGASKSAAIAKSIEGPIASAVSASALQLHPDVTFIIDDAAASQLTQRDYYHRVLEMTALLTPDRLSKIQIFRALGSTLSTINCQIYIGLDCPLIAKECADRKHETRKALPHVSETLRTSLPRGRRRRHR